MKPDETTVPTQEGIIMRLKAYWYYGKKIVDTIEADNRQELKSQILKALFEGGKVPEGEDVSFYWHIGEDN